MKLDKFLALSAYAVQAIATLGAVFVVSFFLSGQEYGHYSLVLATAQSVAVLAFEWVRIAASRFCANVNAPDQDARKHTVQGAFVLTLMVVAVVGVGLVAIGWLQPKHALVGGLIATAMGLTDLLLVFLRARGSFNQFAILQMGRAFTLLAGAALGAYWGRTADLALIGMCVGYGISTVAFVLAAPSWWIWNPSRHSWLVFKELARYGVAAAAASNIHLQVPLAVRWVGRSLLSVEAFAGLSLALDILQKPFALVTSAIGGVLNPGVIVEFESQKKDKESPKLRQIYEIQVLSVLLILGLAIAFLPDVAVLLVPSGSAIWLVQFGPAVGCMCALHAILQSTVAIPGHLLHAGGRLIANAAIELALVGLMVGCALIFEAMRPILWVWLSSIGVVLALIYAAPLLKLVPCRYPIQAAVTGFVLSVALSGCYFLPAPGLGSMLLVKVVVVPLLVSAAALYYKRARQLEAAP